MDGDTLVYNADAFNLSEGSMLSSLIKKLPEVEINKGGEITVNGQRVESMLLNGKDFMNSDRELLLENMPAYMVKKIKSYERIPLTARGTNREKEVQKELVMDIDLKRDYHTGWRMPMVELEVPFILPKMSVIRNSWADCLDCDSLTSRD